ncbi:hypothetical protein MMC30_001549 [Trapelia coarctata]|nr:hypothetical protein [Trapelia coarctata]
MAMQLLRGYLVREEIMDNTQEAVKLLNELAFLFLAIVQAATYINKNGETLAKYLGLLAEQEEDVVELLSEDFEDEGRYRDRGMKNPVAVTWLISFWQIRARNPLAADYLSFIAAKMILDMHRLVYFVTRNWLRQQNHFAEWIIKARQQLSKVFPSHDHTNRNIWRLYLPHAQRILKYELQSGEGEDD